jgi:hypothetical protein
LPADLTGTELAKLLHGTERGHIVQPDKAARLLDLCELPLPRDGIDNAFLCLDSTGHFREAVVIYQAKTNELYHSGISNLAVHLEEQGLTSHPGEEKWIRHSTYETSLGEAEFVFPLTGDYLGAIVRFQNHDARQDVSLTRDFSLVHLDRSFENNRWRLDPKVMTEPVKTEDAEQLNGLMNPMRSWKPHAASLVREQQYDMVAKFGISYLMDVTKPQFNKVVEEAWETWGPASVEEERGDVPTLNFTWHDKDTRFTVRFPFNITQPATEFVAEDHSTLDPAQRAEQVAEWNRQERLTHLKLGHTSHRVPRKLEFEGVELGMKMSKAIDLFNRAAHFNVQKLSDGATTTFAGPAPEKFSFVARQVFLRSDASRNLTEIRVRYQDAGEGSPTAEWCATLLDAWKAKCGAPVTITPTWSGVWPEYSSARPVMYRWLDEQSMLTFQYDDKGVEMVLRNCPADQPEGITLPPLKYLPRGPEGYELGMSQVAVLGDVPTTEKPVGEDMTIVEPKSPSPYDQLQLWFDSQHKLVRVVARHTARDNHVPTQDDQADLLRDFWARSLKSLGWTRRQDMSTHKAVDSLGWQDDCTRLRTYWAKSSGQLHMFTEWKDLATDK